MPGFQSFTSIETMPEELMALYRRTLQANICRASRMRRFPPVLGMPEIFPTSSPVVRWPASLHRDRMVWVGLAVALICVARSLYISRRELPRLRRELEALG